MTKTLSIKLGAGIAAIALGAALASMPTWVQAAPSASNNAGTQSTAAATAAEKTPDKDTTEGADGNDIPTWETDLNCAECHGKEQDSLENNRCLAFKHAALPCTTCHNDGNVLEPVHGGVTVDSKIPKKATEHATVSDKTCLECHGSYEELAQKTADSALLTDEEGTLVNPHAVPSNQYHDDAVTCISCHEVHSKKDATKNAPATCKGCHHENVYTCGTCHAIYL